MRAGICALLSVFIFGFPGEARVSAQTSNQLSEFQEVYGLVQENVPGLKPQDLDHAAAMGLAMALSPRVSLITNSSSASATNASGGLVLKSNMFDGQIAYVRIGRVENGLAAAVRNACQDLGKTNKLKGVVLDLRYAGGEDYQAAGAVADLFIKKEQTLLNWGTGEYNSKHSDDDLDLPVAALVNHDTSGAAEALAGVIRQAGAGLILGRKTSGTAMVAREFPLKNGERLRIATARVMLGDGTALSAQGVAPDITVDVSPADERAYYADAFKALGKSELASSSNLATNRNTVAASSSTTNRPARRTRFNEAELVRERREGVPLDSDLAAERESEPEKPVVRDPVLARALDLLKGLAVVRQAPA